MTEFNLVNLKQDIGLPGSSEKLQEGKTGLPVRRQTGKEQGQIMPFACVMGDACRTTTQKTEKTPLNFRPDKGKIGGRSNKSNATRQGGAFNIDPENNILGAGKDKTEKTNQSLNNILGAGKDKTEKTNQSLPVKGKGLAESPHGVILKGGATKDINRFMSASKGKDGIGGQRSEVGGQSSEMADAPGLLKFSLKNAVVVKGKSTVEPAGTEKNTEKNSFTLVNSGGKNDIGNSLKPLGLNGEAKAVVGKNEAQVRVGADALIGPFGKRALDSGIRNGKNDTALFKDGKNVTTLFRNGKNDTALFKDGKNVTTLFKDGKNDTALFKDGKNDTALFKDGKNDTALFKDGKNDTALFKDGKNDTALFKDGKNDTVLFKDGKNVAAVLRDGGLKGNGAGKDERSGVRGQMSEARGQKAKMEEKQGLLKFNLKNAVAVKGKSAVEPAITEKNSFTPVNSGGKNDIGNSLKPLGLNGEETIKIPHRGTPQPESPSVRGFSAGGHNNTTFHVSNSSSAVNESVSSYDIKPTALMNQIAAGAKMSGRVRIALNPPSLGTLDMDVIVRNNKVHVMLQVENNDVRQILQSNLESLKSSLRNHGLVADTINVSVQDKSDGANHGADYRSEQNETLFKEGKNREGNEEDQSGEQDSLNHDPSSLEEEDPRVRIDGRISLFA